MCVRLTGLDLSSSGQRATASITRKAYIPSITRTCQYGTCYSEHFEIRANGMHAAVSVSKAKDAWLKCFLAWTFTGRVLGKARDEPCCSIPPDGGLAANGRRPVSCPGIDGNRRRDRRVSRSQGFLIGSGTRNVFDSFFYRVDRY